MSENTSDDAPKSSELGPGWVDEPDCESASTDEPAEAQPQVVRSLSMRSWPYADWSDPFYWP
jgi:hypothetical protein